MSKIVIVCPGGSATGGVELLHQFVDRLVANGYDAAICYYPFFKRFEVPAPYRKYSCPMIPVGEIKVGVDRVVLPEVYSYLADRFLPGKIALWWMSVDNYRNSGSTLYALKNFFMPWRYWSVEDAGVRSKIALHLYQSEYAKSFLEGHGIFNTALLSDYINDEYIEMGRAVDHAGKRDILAYNPAKGIDQTRRILPLLNGARAVPIVNMTRADVIRLLSEAKVYIDFGNHPGKDRIPREAAMLGCCIITNKRGSASNAVDIPVPAAYKIDDSVPGFENVAARLIDDVVADFGRRTTDFDAYRAFIASEKQVFDQSARAVAERLSS